MFQSSKWILRIVLVAGVVAVLADSASAQLLRRNRGSYGSGNYNGGYNYYGGNYIPGPSYGLPGDYGTNSQFAGPGVSLQSNYYAPYNDAATIDIRVPMYAKVWFDDEPTRQTGELRFFYTPNLSVGKVYHYTIKVKWVEDGKPLEQTRTIEVRPGAMLVVDFLRPQPKSDNPELIKP